MTIAQVMIAVLFTALFSLIVNFIRFRLSPTNNRLLFCVAVLIFVEVNSAIIDLDGAALSLGMFIFVMTCSFTFGMRGALIGAVISSILIIFQQPGLSILEHLYLIAGYFAAGITSSYYADFLQHETRRNHLWQSQLYRQARELSTVRKIGTALQSTLELDKILHIILTAITAGHGLGFNRAMLFLRAADGKTLYGKAAIGSLSTEEVLEIWNITTREKMKLDDYMSHPEATFESDKALNDHIRNVRIPLDEVHFISEAVKRQKPVRAITFNKEKWVTQWFGDSFYVWEMAVIPLINQGETIGVILVDNHVNQIAITSEDLERLLPLANQAAMAIHNSNLYAKTQEMAITDGLTGLHNQRFFDEMFNTIYNSTRANRVPLSMLVIDIDHFKIYNDTNGHLAGNDLLIAIAKLLKQSVRKEDLTFRFGGEEFVILLGSTAKKDALRIAEKIRLLIQDTTFPQEESQPGGRLTVSIGVATSPTDKQQPRELFEAADQALYAAKGRGRNQVVGFEEDM
jgi:diguanylate cyclase (GGDEF)-like protein